jgi:hypothetical protein
MRIALLFVGLLFFVSCDNHDIEKDKKDILEVLYQQSIAWNEGDIEGYMQGYWKSEHLRFASGDRVTYGWDKTFENYKKAYPNRITMGDLVFSDFQVKIINSESALVFGRWQLFREIDIPHGLFTLNLHKFPEGCKIISDHTSSSKYFSLIRT